MPAASYRVLSEMFRTNLNFTPSPADVASFEDDLAVVSPSLMRAALAEIRDTKQITPGGAQGWREAIYKVYNRKVAEQTQMFPLFHSFETAFRSTVAVKLESHYGEPRWWEPLKTAHRNGGDARTVTHIAQLRISPDTAKAIYYLVDDVTRKKADFLKINDGYELLAFSDLYHIVRLVDQHWAVFQPLFTREGKALSRRHFNDKATKIREARNSVYHHQSFSGMTDVYRTAEDLLAYLNFSLAKVHLRVNYSPCAAPPYTFPLRYIP